MFCLVPFGQLVFSRDVYGDGMSVISQQPDSLRPDSSMVDSVSVESDSLAEIESGPVVDVLEDGQQNINDSLGRDSLGRDTTTHKSFLEDPISGKNQDSLVYDVRNKRVYIYEKGDITYQDKNLKGDYMEIDMDKKLIFAHGRNDTVAGKPTRPEFTDGAAAPYQMDTIYYNIDTEKARIRGVTTSDGDGYLQGFKVKKMKDNTINIANGKYTTCDADHPHFYLAMTKAKAIPGKKTIIGPSYLVMEDVPIYFLGIPFGFFPTMSGRHSGFIMPTWGEEAVKGFFLKDAGYYFAFNDYIDMTVLGGIYTLGSWQASLSSRYVKRYKYSGGLSFYYSKDIVGDKTDPDYVNMNNINIRWTHQQDPKFRPNSTFSASVNFSTSGYSKYGSETLSDYLNTQTNSSISYSKSWTGTPFSFSTNMQHSQNSSDTTISLSFPNVVFNVSRIYPFRRKEAQGKQRWYEKISLSYTGTLGNNVTVKERDLFTDKMFRQMRNGVNHNIPISSSFNLLNYINLSPSATYQERWYFQKIDRAWDPVAKQVVNSDTTSGFYRLYDYNFSVSASTKLYGMYDFGKGKALEKIRHTLTPTVGFTYRPDFSDPKYGYYKTVQSDTLGNTMQYSPFSNGLYGVPSAGRSASLSFSLVQTLEMKVRSQRDTSGTKKISLIDNFSISSSYNFVADSLNLSPFSLSLRTNISQSLGLNVSATLDPYQVDANGRKINKFMWQKGKLGRLTNVSTSFGYSWDRSNGSPGAMNDINSAAAAVPAAYTDMFAQQQPYDLYDPATRRQMMSSMYYDFSIPWNFGFNYTFRYTNNGIRSDIVQTLGFNGSVTLTQKWGLQFSGGYDFEAKRITPGTFTLTRDLHCWEMVFDWVPIGFRKSWSFTIRVKASMLKDLKYDRNSSFYDNFYDD